MEVPDVELSIHTTSLNWLALITFRWDLSMCLRSEGR